MCCLNIQDLTMGRIAMDVVTFVEQESGKKIFLRSMRSKTRIQEQKLRLAQAKESFYVWFPLIKLPTTSQINL